MAKRGSGVIQAVAVFFLVVVSLWGAGPLGAEPLRVGVLRLTSSAPVFIAVEEGYFKEEGLSVELRFMKSAQPVAVALAGRDIDVGATGLTAGLYNALAGGLDARIVADKGRVWPGYQLVGLMVSNEAWDKGLRRIQDLPGRRVGVTQIGSTFHYMLGRVLQKHGIPPSRVRVTPLGGVKNMMDAVATNRIETAFMVQPFCSVMEARKMGHRMFWVSEHLSYQIAGIFLSGSVARQKATALSFLRAYIRGCRVYYDNCLQRVDGKEIRGPAFDRVMDTISKYTGRKPDLIARGLNYNDRNGVLLAQDIGTQINWYHENGLLQKRPDPAKIVDTTLVEKALSQLGP
ncbi:MAG: ABC transporter substrate-binding protein [Deltaproteobacteria bacterium]|nr:ABC transporter substrate-binding protein [Deltaproteobacteria bacterium]MBW1922397.1 ABC transporter substrate-binding protein [Deltaproteobacteria bacterium]MBW1948433.1 ABC transporter substrate-binding protein [Deltaproteobacteria bacterium]MBW2009807.1 ABC transporter substrate-binding protein [Deltaproteobacteria bacterium]MBW2103926.1 ABC transporter substrate-binding protein [Deltaproteobacteria bacterium]